MAKADNKTIIEDRNGSKRIVKRSKLKIGIIVLITLLLLTLVGVGIYFIVKATKKYPYNEDWEIVSVEEATDAILEGDKNIGLYFFSEDSTTSNFMLKDNKIYEDGEDGAGALAEVMTSYEDNDDFIWYGIEIPEDENELIEDILTTEVDAEDGSGDTEYVFRDEFEYLGAGSSLRTGTWIIDSLDGAAEEDFEIEDSAYSSFSLQVKNSYDEDDELQRDILFYDKSTTGTESESATLRTDVSTRESTGTNYSVKDGTMMMFNGTQLTSLVNGWTTVDVSEDTTEDDTADIRDEYHDVYVDFISQLIEHNKEFTENND